MAQFGIGSNLSVPFFAFSNKGDNTNSGTVITNIYNFTGTVINGNTVNNFTVTGGTLIVNQNTVIVGGGLILTNNYDYHITNINEITFVNPVYQTNINIINNYNNSEIDINNLIKGKYPNDIEARKNGVKSGELYRLSIDNDHAMVENAIKYLE